VIVPFRVPEEGVNPVEAETWTSTITPTGNRTPAESFPSHVIDSPRVVPATTGVEGTRGVAGSGSTTGGGAGSLPGPSGPGVGPGEITDDDGTPIPDTPAARIMPSSFCSHRRGGLLIPLVI
jgi:hypothetical protein